MEYVVGSKQEYNSWHGNIQKKQKIKAQLKMI